MAIRNRSPWFPIVFVFLCAGYILQALLVFLFPSEEWKPQQLMHSTFFHIFKFGIIPFQMFRFG